MLLPALVVASLPNVEVHWQRSGDELTKTVVVDGVIHRVSTARVPACTVHFDLARSGSSGPLRIAAYPESPAPGSPHPGEGPDGWQAPYVDPALAVETIGEPSPLGWSYTGTTVGNNAVQASFTREKIAVFTELPPIDLSLKHDFDPTLPSLDSYEAVGAGAFATVNRAHDWFWEAGFREEDGAAQESNFGRGGVEGDPVFVEVIHNLSEPFYVAGCYCNDEDGESPGLVLWNWFNELLSPDRHVALDAGVLVHEYGHIVTTRLVGAPVNADGSSNVQGRALSEGFSDAFALLWQARPEDDPAGAHTVGSWPSLHFIGNGEFWDNYWFGVRTYPYSTDPALSPKHLGHLDPRTYPLPPDVPASPLQIVQDNGFHELGEIYAAFLWEVWGLLRDRYGFEEGRQRMLEMVVLSQKLAPVLPTFADMRDGLIEADALLNGGENWVPIWVAAAERGLGRGAVVPPSHALSPVVPSFEPWDFGDWNADGIKNAIDAVAFQMDAVGTTLRADVNLDQRVDALDWLAWLDTYGQ